jgi:hypothetical protein
MLDANCTARRKRPSPLWVSLIPGLWKTERAVGVDQLFGHLKRENWFLKVSGGGGGRTIDGQEERELDGLIAWES